MRVVGFHQPGEPEVLEVLELPAPTPEEGEVRIRVHAAAVNPTDAVRRQGKGLGSSDGPPYVPGMDAAGVLEEVGPGVDTDLQVGEEVMAIVVPAGSHGAYAEQIVVPVESVVRAPRGASHVEASTLPMNGLTARLALDTLGLHAGDVLAVTGAAGALGGYVVQLAKADGLTVVADAAPFDEALVAELGADLVLPRGEGFAAQVAEHVPSGVDGAVDAALMHHDLVPAVADGGTIITIRGFEEVGERGIQFRPIWVHHYARARDALDRLREQAEDGTVTLRVAEALDMERAPHAHSRLQAGGVRGRLVLTF